MTTGPENHRVDQPFEFNGGVHLRDSLLWFDAPEARELSFISAAMVPGALRHEKIVTSAPTAELLKAVGSAHGRGRRVHEPQILVTPFNRPFSLGELNLELFPSGHSLGAASLAIQVRGRRLVYAGRVSTCPHPMAERLEARHCEVLVLPCFDGSFSTQPGDRERVDQAIVQFVEASFVACQVPVLLCPSLEIAPHVAHLLSTRGLALRAHRKILAAFRVYQRAGLLDLSRMRRYRGSLDMSRRPEALLWPLSLADSPAIAKLSRARRAVVAHRVLAEAHKPQHDAIFPLTMQASLDELVDYVKASEPRVTVLVGAGDEEPAARRLRDEGYFVATLGPRQQLSLFR